MNLTAQQIAIVFAKEIIVAGTVLAVTDGKAHLSAGSDDVIILVDAKIEVAGEKKTLAKGDSITLQQETVDDKQVITITNHIATKADPKPTVESRKRTPAYMGRVD